MHVKEYFFTVVTYLVPLLTWPAHYEKRGREKGTNMTWRPINRKSSIMSEPYNLEINEDHHCVLRVETKQ